MGVGESGPGSESRPGGKGCASVHRRTVPAARQDQAAMELVLPFCSFHGDMGGGGEPLTFGIGDTVVRRPDQHPFQLLVAVARWAL